LNGNRNVKEAVEIKEHRETEIAIRLIVKLS
jgi:ribosomal protein S7